MGDTINIYIIYNDQLFADMYSKMNSYKGIGQHGEQCFLNSSVKHTR